MLFLFPIFHLVTGKMCNSCPNGVKAHKKSKRHFTASLVSITLGLGPSLCDLLSLNTEKGQIVTADLLFK